MPNPGNQPLLCILYLYEYFSDNYLFFVRAESCWETYFLLLRRRRSLLLPSPSLFFMSKKILVTFDLYIFIFWLCKIKYLSHRDAAAQDFGDIRNLLFLVQIMILGLKIIL